MSFARNLRYKRLYKFKKGIIEENANKLVGRPKNNKVAGEMHKLYVEDGISIIRNISMYQPE